ncbi:HPr(Ser) kinase/phosphatase [Liquorilactobacillus satsumensis]|uniref:HPr kinase/phosphorylase n=1 Tax=Liquorilactobacillus satsumensis DSM 16230 = JCM 12392 TaxID=1423801 RepID=A0A0R1V3W1_9LACO|nr:HPr(Ser) kinase/phosphatase [Liquorilactobacillus satsumensis]KRM00199.1 HPr kinase phosphorylase [Liquorilactobacillus satsumensis DSM 16230 = JCM 12392]MCC7665760.1 HPr kinase/phosphorylase [Liquorilactobacillus satsumensis]MCP9313421.1 HPr kinase/phosphorylase [Liquorilactobacillus satsumensis]MCP9328226.1 HPr kinase/phosphorylase [Liquorilactobacillus satsumensis]MCP9356445.1 HPr kinase/phosphorylase [Liquorilactobacillus satsumensis]
MDNAVNVQSLVEATGLKVFSGGKYLKTKQIYASDISRPGLELTGYFDYYPAERIQVLGMTEISYARKMDQDKRKEVMAKLCADAATPCFIISRYLPVPAELDVAAKSNGIPVLRSKLPTTRLLAKLTDFLESQLAERKSLHGVLVDIYGLGVLITGDSGVGKSETALDLIKRGHRLIADDRVEVYQKDEQTIRGEAPKILRHLLEIRGIGIIDVMNLFGAGAVRAETDISLIVHLEDWGPDKQFDRLGSGEQKFKIFDVEVPQIAVPVKIGRNLAIIIEAAAMNFRAKTMGYDATKLFENNLNNLIKENSNEQ